MPKIGSYTQTQFSEKTAPWPKAKVFFREMRQNKALSTEFDECECVHKHINASL